MKPKHNPHAIVPEFRKAQQPRSPRIRLGVDVTISNPAGPPEVHIDGVRLSGINAVTYEAESGKVPMVRVEFCVSSLTVLPSGAERDTTQPKEPRDTDPSKGAQ